MNWFPIGPIMQFAALFTYIILIVIVLSRNPYGNSNRFAAGLFACFAVWSLGEIFLYNPSTPRYLAVIFEKTEAPAWTSFPVLVFWLMVSLTQKKSLYNSAWLKTASFVFPALFTALHWSGLLMHPPVLMGYYWHSQWIDNSLFPFLFFVYYPGCVIGGLAYYAISLGKDTRGFRKKQAVVLFVSTVITLAVGTFFEVIKPVLHLNAGIFDYFNNIYLLIWALGIFIIIYRYKFLALTPESASESIINSMNEALILLDDDMNINYVNQPLLDMLGYRQNELSGRPYHRIIHGPQEANLFLKEVIKNGRIKIPEFLLKKRDGAPLPCIFSASLIMELGEVRGIVCVATDISALLEAENGMRNERDKANEYLAELRESYDKLKELDVLKSNFTSMVSHELRTPITSIKGFITFLLGGVGGALNAQQKEYIGIIRNNSDRLLNLINDLLDTSKMESGSFSINKAPADIIPLIYACLNDVHSLSDNKKISVEMASELPSLTVPVDSYRFTQALVNLINNAIKFSPENSKIDVVVDTLAPAEAAALKLDTAAYARVKVKDSGVGINAGKIGRIFEKYYQVDEINTRKAQGTGLGLYIVKNIVELHGGRVWAESGGGGKGAVFTIVIPLAEFS